MKISELDVSKLDKGTKIILIAEIDGFKAEITEELYNELNGTYSVDVRETLYEVLVKMRDEKIRHDAARPLWNALEKMKR